MTEPADRSTIDDDAPAGVDASETNRELTRILLDSGRRLGLDVVAEFAVPGGRIDVVWTWTPPSPIPGLGVPLPIVGFEIESSWRTRKHIKGDLMNLQDAGVALGVIVLPDTDERDAALRRFAEALADRSGSRVLVWGHENVRECAEGGSPGRPLPDIPAVVPQEVRESFSAGPVIEHTGKYRPLWAWLRQQEPDEVDVSFTEIEQILGFSLPDSCRAHVAHWHSYEGSAVARAIVDAGWHASRVHVVDEMLSLVPGVPLGRAGD